MWRIRLVVQVPHTIVFVRFKPENSLGRVVRHSSCGLNRWIQGKGVIRSTGRLVDIELSPQICLQFSHSDRSSNCILDQNLSTFGSLKVSNSQLR